MKNILLPGVFTLTAVFLFSCERQGSGDSATVMDDDDSRRVVARDTIVTEYEVEETVVEYDTTTRTRTVNSEKERDRDDLKKR
ncbi:hypothetical protein FVR03_04880 [Pontibacter qinzhouensis]|uniref:Uncharacterized protein n=1 Tax=Pontibacter qinzhouensis TaxID=2603253 RepID=A0A5C8KCK3_9BACT|nr:hypothetical protein [Pontibacter qinzhouensis]TXK50520.1 hypothetical protein FVR03_04880 [Pontibacter qinzhouensis]